MLNSNSSALFRSVRFIKTIDRLGPRLRDAEFWRTLNPDLTISDRPPAQAGVVFENAWAQSEPVRRRLVREGVATSPVIVPEGTRQQLTAAVERLVAAGLPPGFVLVYDEFLQLIAALMATWQPLLGADVVMVPRDFWVFHVPAGDPLFDGTAAFGPHRDADAPDARLLAGELPSILNIWLALRDVSTDDSCMYVVPADADPDYRAEGRAVDASRLRLQDVRAVPVSAGQVVMFDPHLIHWGSRSSSFASHARVSLAGFIQRKDGPYPTTHTTDLAEPIRLERRLRWAMNSLAMVITLERCVELARRIGLTDITKP